MKNIVLNEVSKYYDNKCVLNNISFEIEKGKSIGIIGESGSGKSTLARILVGLENYSSGQILIDGKKYSNLTKEELVNKRKNLQLVFQNSSFAVNPNFTVKEVLLEPINIIYKDKFSKQEIDEKITDILTKLDLENINLNQKALSLSGGQLQRLCFARALIIEPDMLILDETFSGLDPVIQIKMIKLLKKWKNDFNLTYILISHNFYACYHLCDKIIVLNQGEKIDEIEFDKNDVVINSTITEKILLEDDIDIPYKFKKAKEI